MLKEAKIYRKNLGRVCAVLMTLCLIFANVSGIKLQAEEGFTLKFGYDDRGRGDQSNFVSITGTGISSPINIVANNEMNVAKNGIYTVTLTPPEERSGFTPIVEVIYWIEDQQGEEPNGIIYSSIPFGEDDENQDNIISLLQNENSFAFVIDLSKEDIKSAKSADVNIFWSEYDRIGGATQYDQQLDKEVVVEYCLEVCISGAGEAYLDIANTEYFTVWEYSEGEGENERHWGGQKILIPAERFDTDGNGPAVKVNCFEGFEFDYFKINNSEDGYKITAEEIGNTEFEYIIKTSFFDNGGYLNTDLSLTQGAPSFNMFFDDHMGGVISIEGSGYLKKTSLSNGPIEIFNYDTSYTFSIDEFPENRTKDCKYIVEVKVYGDEGSQASAMYSNVNFHNEFTDSDSEPNLEITDNSFTVNVPSDENFRGIDVSLWWSEFDRIGPNEEEYCIRVMNDRNGEAYFDAESEESAYPMIWEYSEVDPETNTDHGYGSQKFIIRKSDVELGKAVIKMAPNEGYKFDKIMVYPPAGAEKYKLEGPDANSGSYTLKTTDFDSNGDLMLEIYFIEDQGGNEPGGEEPGGEDPVPVEPGHDGEAFKELIESKQYAFGDWDKDADVDADDLKLGIAQMIYYPEFSSNAGNSFKNQHNYSEITSVDVLKDMITLNESQTDNLTVIDGQGNEITLPAYKYTVSFTDSEDASRSFVAEGIGYLFSFTDDSAYKNYSTENVIMYATDGTTTKYFLRNNHGEEGNPSADCLDPVTCSSSGEGAFCAVADYDCGSQYNEYGRNVGIFGNGASLDDFIMSDPAETNFVTLQGRNEDFARDTNHSVIFGKFSFYKPEFTGMKIQGIGQNGNTPAWSFATDPIWGSDADINTEKEAIVYFGNSSVLFKPIKINNYIEKFVSFEKVDTRIPDLAVSISCNEDLAVVTFNTDFYDMVEFKVTYQTAVGLKTEYIWLHRVGIDINEGHFNAGENILHHGTENGPKITLEESYDSLIYATYYYPEYSGTTYQVDLYATYTWKDGSVTKELIANDSSLNLEFHHKDTVNTDQDTDDLQSSDFILYKGSKEDAPVKVEVSAIKSGSTDTEFAGMKFGSGRGVCYTTK